MATNESDLSRAERASLRERVSFSGPGKLWLIGAGVLIIVALGAHWIYYRWTHVYLDDARIDGEVVTISSRVSGWITELPVTPARVLAALEEKALREQRAALERVAAAT